MKTNIPTGICAGCGTPGPLAVRFVSIVGDLKLKVCTADCWNAKFAAVFGSLEDGSDDLGSLSLFLPTDYEITGVEVNGAKFVPAAQVEKQAFASGVTMFGGEKVDAFAHAAAATFGTGTRVYVCDECGRRYTTSPFEIHNKKVCGLECRGAVIAQKLHDDRLHDERVTDATAAVVDAYLTVKNAILYDFRKLDGHFPELAFTLDELARCLKK